jgi:hypothetical protein
MLRTFSLAAIAAVALSAPATTALAQGDDAALAAFEKVCWAGAGDYLGTVGAANADGWKDSSVISDTPAGLSITDKTAREKSAGGATLTLLVTRGLQHTAKSGDFAVMTCKLSANKAVGGMMADSKAWMGGAAADNTPPDPTFAVYYVANGGATPSHIGLAGTQGAMNTSGAFGVLKFQSDSDSATFVYQVFSKPKA